MGTVKSNDMAAIAAIESKSIQQQKWARLRPFYSDVERLRSTCKIGEYNCRCININSTRIAIPGV